MLKIAMEKFVGVAIIKTDYLSTALEDLHKNEVLYRGVSPDVLIFDQEGHLQLVDFRFGKKLSGERTFTICGMADSLASEIVQGKGHGLPADWHRFLVFGTCLEA